MQMVEILILHLKGMGKNKMSDEYYSIYIENNKIADHIPLTYALIFIKAIYLEFYNEKNLKVIIQKENYEVVSGEEI